MPADPGHLVGVSAELQGVGGSLLCGFCCPPVPLFGMALEPWLCPLLVCLRAGDTGGGSRVVSLWHPLDEGTVRVVDFVLPAAVECWSGTPKPPGTPWFVPG